MEKVKLANGEISVQLTSGDIESAIRQFIVDCNQEFKTDAVINVYVDNSVPSHVGATVSFPDGR